jgi:pimeloyl-ACP methyl ester carboxylesterase
LAAPETHPVPFLLPEVTMLREMLNRTASQFDEAIGAALFHRSARSRARSRSESLGHVDRLSALREVTALYDRPEHYDPDGGFFAPPELISPRVVPVRSLRGGEVADWYWPSAFDLHCVEVADRYLGCEENRTAAARVFLHGGGPRPAVILLHGYRAGQWALEERLWPIDWLFENGLDVVLPVLPFHAVRARRRGAPLFPGSDPRITNEGFRQAVLDVRTLARHLRERGAPDVGVMGMSLGGYTTSLLATLERRLSFAVPMIPLASIAHMARGLGRLTGTPDEQRAQFEALEGAYRPVSPLARPLLLDPGRVLVLGAEGDRITPLDHARWLATHFGAPLHVFHGGHILQFGRGEAFRAVGRMLGRLGLFFQR